MAHVSIILLSCAFTGGVAFSSAFDWKYAYVGRYFLIIFAVVLATASASAEVIFHHIYPNAPTHVRWWCMSLSFQDMQYLIDNGPKTVTHSLFMAIMSIPFGCMVGQICNNFKTLKTI